MLIDTTTMRDVTGRTLLVGHTIKAFRRSPSTGRTFAFNGYVAAIQLSEGGQRLEALCQPFDRTEPKWLGSQLIEVETPDDTLLRGVIGEWIE